MFSHNLSFAATRPDLLYQTRPSLFFSSPFRSQNHLIWFISSTSLTAATIRALDWSQRLSPHPFFIRPFNSRVLCLFPNIFRHTFNILSDQTCIQRPISSLTRYPLCQHILLLSVPTHEVSLVALFVFCRHVLCSRCISRTPASSPFNAIPLERFARFSIEYI